MVKNLEEKALTADSTRPLGLIIDRRSQLAGAGRMALKARLFER